MHANFCYSILFSNASILFSKDKSTTKNESFNLELFNPTGGSMLGKFAKTVVTVINDDGKQMNI